jgi:hypothetical protein
MLGNFYFELTLHGLGEKKPNEEYVRIKVPRFFQVFQWACKLCNAHCGTDLLTSWPHLRTFQYGTFLGFSAWLLDQPRANYQTRIPCHVYLLRLRDWNGFRSIVERGAKSRTNIARGRK